MIGQPPRAAPGVVFTIFPMASVLGSPGGHAKTLARKAMLRASAWGLAGAFLCFSTFVVWASGEGLLRSTALVAGVLGSATASYKFNRSRIAFGKAYAGAAAEIKVSSVLRRRGGLEVVVNGAAIADGDVDHVALGPVLAVVETKHGRGRVSVGDDQVKVGGKRIPRDPIGQALRQARNVQDVVGRNVEAIVCITDMDGEPFRSRGCWVTSARHLPSVIRSLPQVLDVHAARTIGNRLHRVNR